MYQCRAIISRSRKISWPTNGPYKDPHSIDKLSNLAESRHYLRNALPPYTPCVPTRTRNLHWITITSMHLGTHSAEYKLVTLICSTNKKRTNKKMLTNVRPSATADFIVKWTKSRPWAANVCCIKIYPTLNDIVVNTLLTLLCLCNLFDYISVLYGYSCKRL